MNKIIALLLVVFMIVGLFPGLALAEQTPEQLFDSILKNDSKAYCRLLTDNVKAWYARWHMIEHAKETIDITYFNVEDDVFGMSLLGLLKKKAADGVKIRFMVDARGTMALSRKMHGQDYLQELVENPNIKINVYNPLSGQLLSMFKNIRNLTGSNHDKITIVDGEWMITGGRNIAYHYFVDPKDNPGVWRDTDVLFKGKYIAGEMKKAFEEEFNHQENYNVKKDLFVDFKSRSSELEFYRRAMQRYMQGRGIYKKTTPALTGVLEKVNKQLLEFKSMQDYTSFRPFQGQRQFPAAILDKHSFIGSKNDITKNMCKLIDACKKEIIIQNPYVVLTDDARAALQRASDRGVSIILHTNSPVSTDSLLTQAFFVKDWKEVMAAMPTLKIYAFTGKRKLHAKVFVFDGVISLVGTYNMDYVSEQINSEVVTLIKSKTFAKRLSLRIMKDIKVSAEYKVEVQKDGKIKVIYGPGSHSPKEIMDKLKRLSRYKLLKYLI